MKINTIDDRIRKEARDTLKVELYNAKQTLYKSLQLMGCSNIIRIKSSNTRTQCGAELLETYAYDKLLIDTIFDDAFERQVLDREEKAVSEFMTKVNSLQEQIDDLQWREE
jgi:hypothetical protein